LTYLCLSFANNFQLNALLYAVANIQYYLGVFGVASDECLFNAIENRRLWELEGLGLVTEMADSFMFELQTEQTAKGRNLTTWRENEDERPV
jgi:hypothetical protein